MFTLRAAPPTAGGGQAQAPPYRPPPGKLAFIANLYHDPFYWSVTKSVVGFFAGVIVARQISEELTAAGTGI